jgi:hypothetical protein
MRNTHTEYIWKHEGKGQLLKTKNRWKDNINIYVKRTGVGRPRRRWADNIKMDLREIGWDGRDWIDLAQDRDRWRAYVNAAMNLRVP